MWRATSLKVTMGRLSERVCSSHRSRKSASMMGVFRLATGRRCYRGRSSPRKGLGQRLLLLLRRERLLLAWRHRHELEHSPAACDGACRVATAPDAHGPELVGPLWPTNKILEKVGRV